MRVSTSLFLHCIPISHVFLRTPVCSPLHLDRKIDTIPTHSGQGKLGPDLENVSNQMNKDELEMTGDLPRCIFRFPPREKAGVLRGLLTLYAPGPGTSDKAAAVGNHRSECARRQISMQHCWLKFLLWLIAPEKEFPLRSFGLGTCLFT
jgi:hypothetical protein